MALTAFTTYNDIRAIIGITEDELPDTELALDVFLFGLESEIKAVSSTLLADYTAAVASRAATNSTAIQDELYKATRLFSTAQVALTVALTLPLRAQKSITDGKAAFSRFTDSPFKASLENLNSLLSKSKSNLQEVYAEFNGTTTQQIAPVFVSVVSPAVDPVTG